MLRSACVLFYKLINFAYLLPSLLRTVLIDLVLVAVLLLIIYEFLIAGSSFFIQGIVLAFVSIIVFIIIPIFLLSFESLISKENNSEDAFVVMKILKKKKMRKQTRIRKKFSAFGIRYAFLLLF